MPEWLIENLVGLAPPFISRKPASSGVYPQIPHKACSITYILGLSPMVSYASSSTFLMIRSLNNHNVLVASLNTMLDTTGGLLSLKTPLRVVSYTCYDEMCMYFCMLEEREFKIFYCHFSGCYTLKDPVVFLYEVKLFQKNAFFKVSDEPAFKLELKTLNLKGKTKGALHYVFNGHTQTVCAESQWVCAYDGAQYEMNKLCCIFCFAVFATLDSLVRHLELVHCSFKILKSGNLVTIENQVLCKQNKGKQTIAQESFECSSENDEINSSNVCGNRNKYNGKHHKKTCQDTAFRSGKYRTRKIEYAKNSGVPKFEYVNKRMNVWSSTHQSTIDKLDFTDAVSLLVNRNVDKFTSLGENYVRFIKKWNALRIQRRPFISDLKRMIVDEQANPVLIEFLCIVRNKALVSDDEMISLMHEICTEKK